MINPATAKRAGLLLSLLLALACLTSLSASTSYTEDQDRAFKKKAPEGLPPGAWSQQTSGTANNLFSVHFVSDNEGWAVGFSNTILHTTNGGANWTAQTNQSGVTVSSYLGVRFIDSNTGWAGGGSEVVRTTDGGASWTAQGATQDGRFRNNLFAVSPTVAWIPASNSTLTARWFSRFTVGVGEQNFNVLGGSSQYFDMYFTDVDNGWSVGTGPIVRITNGSSASPTFAFQTTCPCPTLNGIHMLNSTTGWAVGNGGLILKTTDGGSTWPAQTSGTTTNLRSVHFVDANTGWAVGGGGLILASTDGGATWTPEASGVTTDLRRVFFVNANTGYVVGHGGTILKRAPQPQTFVVTNTNDSGAGSLRQAIADANANTEDDTIIFNIPTSDKNFDGSTFNIRPLTEFTITDGGTFIDGASQAAFTGDTNTSGPEIVIDGSTCPTFNCDGFKVQSSNNRIHSLVINQMFGNGIKFEAGAIGNTVTGCYVGTDPTGTMMQIFFDKDGIASAGGNTIGGANPGDGNLISGCGNGPFGGLVLGSGDQVRGNKIGTNAAGTGAVGNNFYGIKVTGSSVTIENNVISGSNGPGVLISGASASSNTIRANKIGTDITGTLDVGNGDDGIEINGAASNTIGGLTAADRNIISGNNQNGVSITGSTATGNLVQGNYIGTDIAGTAALRNNSRAVNILNAPGNTIGGTAAGARNILSGGSSSGVSISDINATGNIVQGNYIGTDVTGTVDLGNTFGVVLFAPGNTIGGTAAGAGNVISGNERGMDILFAGTGNLIQGNLIGTNAAGTAALANTLSGILCMGSNNTIGGTAAGARNIISGNGLHGIEITNTGGPPGPPSGNQVLGNYIGTDITGAIDIGNGQDGVHITGSSSNAIGGASIAARNVISGNNGHGVHINTTFGASNGNTVQGNFIGLQANGTTALPNSQSGVLITGNGSPINNVIGGAAAGAGNVIAHNGAGGVVINTSTFDPATGNAVLSNSIFSNMGLGIDLGNAGVTPNDSGDADAGANNLQNFPVLTSATSSGGNTSILGVLHSTPSAAFRIEFFLNTGCDPSGNGEGAIFIGSINTSTDASGISSFNANLPVSIPSGNVVTATATDSSNNSSEFSRCVIVPLIALSPATLPGGTVGTVYNQAITASGGTAPYSFVVSAGALPAGLSLSTAGVLSGTPTAAGGFTFTVKATDSGSMMGSRSYTIAIASPDACASASFDTPTFYPAGLDPQAIIARDFNHDGRLDLAVPNGDSNTVSILLGTDVGSFGLTTNFGVGSRPQSVAAADFNGDTHLDLAVPNESSADVSILLGDGTGSFGGATSFSTGAGSQFVAIGDFNTDTKLDLVVANFTSNNISLLLGDGMGGFGAATGFDAGATNHQAVAAGDFNGDGALDVAVTLFNSDAVSILLGNGMGGFGSPTLIDVGDSPWAIAAGDFNEDGKADLAVGRFQGSVAVILGDGVGSFTPQVNNATGQAPSNMEVADINGDGHQDIAVATINNTTVSLLIGNGAGSFAPAIGIATGLGPTGIAVGDFDGNGTNDLAVARLINDGVLIHFNECCLYKLAPHSAFFTARGGDGSLNITGVSKCDWVATSDDSWITITSDNSGIGASVLTYVVRENFSPLPRQGALTVAGRTFPLTQAGQNAPSCSFTVSPLFQNFSSAGGTNSINVTTTSGCAWQAASNVSWIRVTSNCCAIGSGTITYTAEPNMTGVGRNGVITIGGQKVNVKQQPN